MRRTFQSIGLLIVLLFVGIAGSWLIYMPNAQERGVWRAQAGNMLIRLGPLQADVYGESSHSCGKLFTFPAHLKLVELMEGAVVDMQGDQMRLMIDGELQPHLFDRIDAVPDACLTAIAPTPRNVFDALWTAMDEYYAFFDLYGVDWNARRSLAPAPDAQMSDAELFALLGDTLKGLDDGHLQLGAAEQGYFSPKTRPAWLPENSPLTRNSLRAIARNNAGTALIQDADSPFAYGIRDDGLAYLQIKDMNVVQAWGQSSRDAAALQFAPIADVLNKANGLVIDVRHNPGGSDPISFGIAGHFTGTPVPALSKTTRIGDAQTAPFAATLAPHDDTPLTMPVILLTSDMTGSAAEIFTIVMRELPQVTTMGEPTSGGLSDILGFTLPNGWALGLSHQTYFTPDGDVFEGIGVPPDVSVAFVAADFEAGRDPVLDAAFDRLLGRN